MIGKIFNRVATALKSVVHSSAVDDRKISQDGMAQNLAPEASNLNDARAMESANTFFLSLHYTDQGRAVNILIKDLQDALRTNDQRVLLRFFLFRLRVIASAIHRNVDIKSSLIKFFDDVCAKLLDNPGNVAAYLEDLALPSDATEYVEAGFKSMIENVSVLHRPERSMANLKILLLSDLIISKKHSEGFFKSLIGSKWFQYVMNNGHPEDPMVVFHLITTTTATGNCFPIIKGDYILAMTKLVIKWAVARPNERWISSNSTFYEIRTNNIKNQLLEFFFAADCFLSIPDEDLRKILRHACDNIVTKDALQISALAASDFAFSLEKKGPCSHSADLCSASADIMIEYILLNLLDSHHADKNLVWCAIGEVNAVVQKRGSLQTKLMFQV